MANIHNHSSGNLNKKHTIAHIQTVIAVLPVVAGGLIYLLWRPGTTRLITWLDTLGLGNILISVRHSTLQLSHMLPDFIVYSLPNGLWAFSYAFIVALLWCRHKSSLKIFWLATIPVVGLGYETLQALEVIGGTFCFVDLSLCFAGITAGILLAFKLKTRRQQHV